MMTKTCTFKLITGIMLIHHTFEAKIMYWSLYPFHLSSSESKSSDQYKCCFVNVWINVWINLTKKNNRLIFFYYLGIFLLNLLVLDILFSTLASFFSIWSSLSLTSPILSTPFTIFAKFENMLSLRDALEYSLRRVFENNSACFS